jgi:hypothetical protein
LWSCHILLQPQDEQPTEWLPSSLWVCGPTPTTTTTWKECATFLLVGWYDVSVSCTTYQHTAHCMDACYMLFLFIGWVYRYVLLPTCTTNTARAQSNNQRSAPSGWCMMVYTYLLPPQRNTTECFLLCTIITCTHIHNYRDGHEHLSFLVMVVVLHPSTCYVHLYHHATEHLPTV